MKTAHERAAIGKLRSVETAEQYLIARTHAELSGKSGKHDADSVASMLYKPIMAFGLTATFLWMVQTGEFGQFVSATI